MLSQSPFSSLYSPGRSAVSSKWRFKAGYNVPLINDDLPEPLTPVTTVKAFKGISMSIPLRLFIRAPVSRID